MIANEPGSAVQLSTALQSVQVPETQMALNRQGDRVRCPSSTFCDSDARKGRGTTDSSYQGGSTIIGTLDKNLHESLHIINNT